MSTKAEPPIADHAESERHKLLKILIWPSVFLILAVLFYQPIRDAIGKPGTTVEIGPNGARIIGQQIDKATEKQAEGARIPPGAEERAADSAQEAQAAFSKLFGRTILWVDDHPENNVFLQNAFAEAGVRVFNAYDNEHARELLAQRSFDLAITDVSRDAEGTTAGLQLHPLLQNAGIPIIVYSGSWSASNRGQERQHQVLQITSDPSVVYSAGIASLGRRK